MTRPAVVASVATRSSPTPSTIRSAAVRNRLPHRAPQLVDLVEQGWRLVVSHGNGPQVGFILRRSELSQDEVDPIPIDYAVADTQGAIGYMFVKALTNELARRGLARPVVAIVTQTVVDPPTRRSSTRPSRSAPSSTKPPPARANRRSAGR